jgi:serine protease Do
VTNNHVVSGTDVVTVTFNDRNSAQAKVIGTDPSTDLAVIKIDEKDLPYIEFGNSDEVHLGQWVLAVGYPLTLDATVTAGIVSAKARSIGINATRSRSAIESFIQTDAVVNPGNSGGPLVNDKGQVIGINSAIASPTGSYAGYSYAIPANIVRKVASDIIQYGAVQRAYLGIEPRDYKNASAQEISRYGLNKAEGIYVVHAAPAGGAAAAGIRSGDFITAVNSIKVNTIPQLNELLSSYKPGDKVSVTYTRNGTPVTVSVELRNIKGNTSVIKEAGPAMVLGASFRPLSSNEQRMYKIMKGLVLTDVGNGLLKEQTTIKKGFIVSGVNGNPVSEVAQLDQALATGGQVQLEGFYPDKNGMYYYNINTGTVEEP